MKERNIVLLVAGGFLAFALVGSVIVSLIYQALAAGIGLLMLPVWSIIFQRMERSESSKKG